MSEPALARRLGAFDATMIVMGGIIGSGIFINPYVVAQHVHSPALIIGAWAVGGAIALLGSFVYAELAALRPEAGGQYAYLRDAYHPAVAFLYGWALLLVVQSGGMAAVAVTFARYTIELTGIHATDALFASITLIILTIINILGVRSGSNTQSALMILKLVAIAMLIVFGFASSAHRQSTTQPDTSIWSFFAAMTPVMFAYGGWQTASFMSAELKNPRRDLAVGLLAGVIGVITVYVLVNIVMLYALGSGGLAATSTPASAVMRAVLGERGAKLIAIGIAISTLGFLSQSMLTAPRVYYAMATDRVFFRAVARVHPVTRVPYIAITLQGIVAIIITVSGKYEQILSYVVAADFIFFGLTGAALFVFRHRGITTDAFRTPGHPLTTAIFTLACWTVVIATIVRSPIQSAIGLAIIAAGGIAYAMWTGRKRGVRVALLAIAIAFVFAAVVLALQKPSVDRDWTTEQRVLPNATIRGDTVEIGNVRNFRWRGDHDFVPGYDTRTYDLRRLDSVSFVMSPFGPPGVAHTFLTFGFGNDDYVAISVEARKERGEIYTPLRGLLRQYEVMYVIGDERDVVALRTNIWRDPVYLYPIRTTPDKMRRVFVDMIQRANALAAHPEFYNTLTNNCTTNIVRHVNAISPHRIPFSYKVMLPGYSDSFAYELGLIDSTKSFEETRAAHRIDTIAQRAGVTDNFSRVIRGR